MNDGVQIPQRFSAGVRAILLRYPQSYRDAILKGRIRNKLFLVIKALYCVEIDMDRHSRDNVEVCKTSSSCRLVCLPEEVSYYTGLSQSARINPWFNSYEQI